MRAARVVVAVARGGGARGPGSSSSGDVVDVTGDVPRVGGGPPPARKELADDADEEDVMKLGAGAWEGDRLSRLLSVRKGGLRARRVGGVVSVAGIAGRGAEWL